MLLNRDECGKTVALSTAISVLPAFTMPSRFLSTAVPTNESTLDGGVAALAARGWCVKASRTAEQMDSAKDEISLGGFIAVRVGADCRAWAGSASVKSVVAVPVRLRFLGGIT